MLSDYDTQAISTVMGLAFLREEQAAAPTPPASESRQTTATPDRAFVIVVDGAPMQLAERTSTDHLAPFHGSSPFAGHAADIARRRVASPSPAYLEKAVEHGLPRNTLRHVAEWLAGGDRAKIAALEWGVVPKTTLERRVKKLSPQESERTERVARLAVHAIRALGTDAEARAFMTSPHPELDGRSPVDAAMTDLGTRRAERVLNALEYGLAV